MPRLRWRDRRGTFREHSPTWREGRGTFREHLSAWREGCGTFRKHLSAWREGRGTFREHSPLGARVAELSASTLRLARPSRHFPRAPSAWREGCGTFRDRLSRATGPCGISRDRHSRFRHQSFKVVPASADAVPSRVPARHLGLRGSAAPRQAVSPSLFRSTGGGRPFLLLDNLFISLSG